MAASWHGHARWCTRLGVQRPTLASLWSRLSATGGQNALLYTATSILAKGATILLAPLYTRELTTVEYGDLALAQTLVAVLPTFVSIGLLSALSRFFYEGANADEGRARAGGVARWIITLALSTAFVLQALLFVLPLPGKGIFQFHELSCVVWAATGALMLGVPMVVLRASQRAVPASLLQLTDFAISLGAAIVLVAGMGRGIRGALEAVALSGITSSMVCFVYVLRTMPGRLDTVVLKRALAFSMPYVPHFVANQLLLISDRWILKSYGFDEGLGLYSLASQLAAPISIVVLAWNEAVSPKMGEEFRKSGMPGLEASTPSVVKSYAGLAVAMSVVMLVFSPLVFGKSYGHALWYLPGLCFVLVVECFYYPYSNVLFFANRTSLIPKITFGSGLINVVSNLILVPLLGVPGAIVSRVIGGGARSFASYRFARGTFKEPPHVSAE